jgi:hypothetical protein
VRKAGWDVHLLHGDARRGTWQSADPANAKLAALASAAAVGSIARDVSADMPSECSATCSTRTYTA